MSCNPDVEVVCSAEVRFPIGEHQMKCYEVKENEMNEIVAFMHCKQCMDELPSGVSPREFAQIEVGYTGWGFQIWCKRHEMEIESIDLVALREQMKETDDDKWEK
jgi:hypothetical protein